MVENNSGQITIIPDNNQVNLQDVNQTITVTDNISNTIINVIQPTTQVVQVLTGPIGPTGTLPTSGSLNLTGSISVSGSITANNFIGGVFSGSFVGSIPGTASYALQALSSSYASTASYIKNAQTASYVLNAVSASYSTTSSYSLISLSSSYALTSSYSNNSTTSSYALNATSASYALTASYWSGSILNTTSASYALTSSYSTNFTVANTLIINETLTDFAKITSTISGSNNLFTQAIGSYTSAFGKYTLFKGANSRAGEFMTSINGTTTKFTDISTADIGNTTDVGFSSSIATGNIKIDVLTASSGWTVKMLVTYL